MVLISYYENFKYQDQVLVLHKVGKFLTIFTSVL